MTCRCTANTLRLFIRSVAQVDIPTSARFTTSRRDLCSSSTRGFGKPRAFESRHTFQKRYNSTISSSSEQSESSLRQTEAEEGEENAGGQVRAGSPDVESAIAEISMEAIDALAADSSDAGLEVHFEDEEPIPSMPSGQPARSTRNETPSNIIFRGTGFTPNSSSEQQTSNIPSRRTGFTLGAPDATPDYRTDRTSTRGFQGPKSSENDASKTPAEDGWVPPKKEPWQVHKAAMKEKFPDGWNPQKRLSPDAMAGIRALHQQMPEKYTSWVLADHFKISPEAIRRILKSKWSPDADTQMDREMRWFRRGERVWSRYAELGVKPPRKWRDEGIGRGKPEWLKKRQQKQEPRVIPALITTARREDGYYGESREPTRNSERPQLVTTARPPEGH